MRRRSDRDKYCLRNRKETDEIVPEAYHQEEAQEGHRPGEDQDVDRLEIPCMVAMLIVIIQSYEVL